jgi:hypothetical protein
LHSSANGLPVAIAKRVEIAEQYFEREFPAIGIDPENRKRLPQEKRHKPRPNHEGGCFASVRRHRQENHVAESKIEDGYNGFFPKLKEVWSLDAVRIAC